MTNNERNSVWNTGKANGGKVSTADPSKLIMPNGNRVSFEGNNRTRVGSNVYYGGSNANNALNGSKK